MPALVINGLTVPIGADSLRRTIEEVGERTRAFDGSAVLNRRWSKRVFDFLIPIASQVDQLAWSTILRGEGHVFGFDSNLYSAKGLPVVGASAAIGASGPTPKFGANRLGTGASSATIATKLGAAWTVLTWYWSGSAWDHYAITSTGQKWVNGTRNDAASTTWLTVSSVGDVTLSASIFLDSLACLPAVVPTTWPPVLAATGRAFPPLPRLEAYGDLFPGSSSSSPVFVRGDATSLDYAPAWVGGVWTPASGALVSQVVEE